ncbi:hypothetical protein Ae201684P_002394 [Aphanomyces euteiches]|nr:hypothetical protein Ae201684P_002394 [Aphanomyces euteiches]
MPTISSAPKKEDQVKNAARWNEEAVERMFQLRYKDFAGRFDHCKNTQAKKEAYILLAAELSLQMGVVYDATQFHELRKKWTSPSLTATGNGDLVQPKPQFYDIMLDYWGMKPGLSRDTLFSTEVDILDPFNEPGDDKEPPLLSVESETTEIKLEKKTSERKQVFSARRQPSVKSEKTSSVTQAEALMSGLDAVGKGLNGIGAALAEGPSSTSNDQLVAALERQTDAFVRQADQMQQLLSFLVAKENR